MRANPSWGEPTARTSAKGFWMGVVTRRLADNLLYWSFAMGFERLYQGQKRGVFVYDSRRLIYKWMKGMNRPPHRIIWKAIRWVCDRPLPDLMRSQRIWIPLAGTTPRLFEIRKDQARLYCCMKDGDIYILDWVQKKQPRAPKSIIARAEKRAREILKDG